MAPLESGVPPPAKSNWSSRACPNSVADLLRGDYKQSEYGKVILPLTVLRRLDCVLEPTYQVEAIRSQQKIAQ
jgi:type I restriction-modification system DNA methylase subunit